MVEPGKPTVNEAGEVDRREAILRAAVRVFAQKGYHGCRIADVAREAGVAYGLIYHYFQNKQELLRSVFDESFGYFSRLLGGIASSDGPAGGKVGQIVEAAFAAYRHDPDAMRVLVLEVLRSPVFREAEQRSAFQDAIRTIASVLRQGMERGELRPMDPFLTATALFGAIEMALTTLIMETPGTERAQGDAAARGLVDLFLVGLLKR